LELRLSSLDATLDFGRIGLEPWILFSSVFNCRMPGLTDYKAIRPTNFQGCGLVLLSFSARRGYEGRWKGLRSAMGQDERSAGPDHGQFDNTRWSLVLEAVQSQAPGAPQALAELCTRYWRPLYAFARRRAKARTFGP
jgi:hypothetical protein